MLNKKKEKEISVLYFTGKEHLGSLTKSFYDEPDFDFPFLCSNIHSSSAYIVFVSRLI